MALLSATAYAQSPETPAPGISSLVTEAKDANQSHTAMIETQLNFSSVRRDRDARLTLRADFGLQEDASPHLNFRGDGDTFDTFVQRSFLAVGLDGQFLAARLEVSSTLGLSGQWRASRFGNLHGPQSSDHHSALAQSHRIKLKAVDRSDFRLSMDGTYARSNGYYSPVAPGRAFSDYAAPGENMGLGVRARVGELGLRGSWRQVESDYLSSERWKLSADYSGLSVSMSRKGGRFPNFQTQTAEGPPLRSHATTYGVEITPVILFSSLASDDVYGAIVPQTLSLEIGDRSRQRYGRDGLEVSIADTLSATATWNTPLGDTVLVYDRQMDHQLLEDGFVGHDSSLLIDHAFDLGQWSLGPNVMLTRSRKGTRSSPSDTRFAYFGLSASAHVDGGPEVSLMAGRDAMDLHADQGDFLLQDKTTRLDISLDFTDMLNQAFGHDGLFLRFEGRMDFGKSGYELRLFDDVIDGEWESLDAQGFRVAFGTDW